MGIPGGQFSSDAPHGPTPAIDEVLLVATIRKDAPWGDHAAGGQALPARCRCTMPIVRIAALLLFLVSMPLTVIDSRGPGFFVDKDGWQGSDVALYWPLCAMELGAWWFIPLGMASAYIVCGMWLTRAARFLHLIGALACGATVVMLPLFCIRDLRWPFVLLEVAWILAAFSGLAPRPSDSLRSSSVQPADLPPASDGPAMRTSPRRI